MKPLLAVVLLALAVAAGGSAAGPPRFRSYMDPAWSPDGKQIAYADTGDVPGDLYVANADGSDVRTLTASAYPGPDYAAREPSWSPDGRRIVFAYGSYGLAVVNADGSGLHRISSDGDQPAWAPGGKRIAFASDDETSGNAIYVVNPDGSHRQLVARVDVEHSANGPAWSRDGQRLAFGVGSAPDTGARTNWLGVVTQYGGRATRYARGLAPSAPDWSPDGRRIVFASGYRNPRLAVLTLRTRTVRRLAVHGFRPRYSPDGRRIAFTCDGEICLMNADGSHVVRFTH